VANARPWRGIAVLRNGRLAGCGPDPEQEAGGAQVAQRIGKDRHRRRDDPDEEAAEARAQDLSRRPRDLEPRVALGEAIAIDQLGQDRLVGDLEENRQDPSREPDHVELPHGQRAGQVRDGDEREDRRPAEVRRDQDASLGQSIHPRASREREEHEGQELDRPEQGDRQAEADQVDVREVEAEDVQRRVHVGRRQLLIVDAEDGHPLAVIGLKRDNRATHAR